MTPMLLYPFSKQKINLTILYIHMFFYDTKNIGLFDFVYSMEVIIDTT